MLIWRKGIRRHRITSERCALQRLDSPVPCLRHLFYPDRPSHSLLDLFIPTTISLVGMSRRRGDPEEELESTRILTLERLKMKKKKRRRRKKKRKKKKSVRKTRRKRRRLSDPMKRRLKMEIKKEKKQTRRTWKRKRMTTRNLRRKTMKLHQSRSGKPTRFLQKQEWKRLEWFPSSAPCFCQRRRTVLHSHSFSVCYLGRSCVR
ncbi:hypothetical protein V1515DRAFT_39654 [Lipomyces mesembrius]